VTAVLGGQGSVDTLRPRPHSTGSAPIRIVPPLPLAQNALELGGSMTRRPTDSGAWGREAFIGIAETIG
jgi:hypothetical protein